MSTDSGRPNNLPPTLTSFIGRETDCEQAEVALAESRVVVLTGPGGVGKTRLAVEVARRAAGSYPDGAWWVELASISDAALTPTALAEVLGVRPFPGRSALEAVTERLGSDRALIVLDNCEHLLGAAAELCAALVLDCPEVTILATSREALGLAGESVVQVPPLALPTDLRNGTVTAAMVRASDAGQVFLQRARRARSSFELSDRNAEAVAQICRELDGVPLAIELAAARVQVLSVEQIAERLSDRFRLLTAAPRGSAERQQTLRGSVDWSYDLLAEPERMLFRRLAVFAGSWSLEAVEAVCSGAGLEVDTVFDLLASLVAKSLALVDERDGSVRYRMLETVRQYAIELLEHEGELDALRDRHLDFFVKRAERAAIELETPRNLQWLHALEPDAANVESAILHGLQRSSEKTLRLGVGLTMWWNMRGRFAAGQRALEDALAATDPAPSALRARALWSRGHLASYRGDYEVSVASFEQAKAMADAVADESTSARALFSLTALGLPADPRATRPSFRSAIALAGRAEDEWALMSALTTLAWSYLMTEEFTEAENVLGEAANAIELTGLEGAVWRSLGLGWCAMAAGDHPRARRDFEAAIANARLLGDPVTEGFGHVLLTRLELMLGHVESAIDRATAGETAAVGSGAFMVLPSARVELARSHAAAGRLEDARELLDAVVTDGADRGWTLCEALLALTEVDLGLGNTEAARADADRALELSERLGADALGASARESLARLAIRGAEWKRAETFARTALAQRVSAGTIGRLPQSLDPLAQIAAGLDSFQAAARLVGVTERALADLGTMRSPLEASDIETLEHSLRDRLGPEAFATAKAQGAAMSLDEAVAWVGRARGRRGRTARGWGSLTPTESRVVGFIAQGMTNPQIAERMFVSPSTVKAHLAHIFGKLSVRSRSELAAMAVRESD